MYKLCCVLKYKINLVLRNSQSSFPLSLVLKVHFNYTKVSALMKELAVNSIRVIPDLQISDFPECLWLFVPGPFMSLVYSQ